MLISWALPRRVLAKSRGDIARKFLHSDNRGKFSGTVVYSLSSGTITRMDVYRDGQKMWGVSPYKGSDESDRLRLFGVIIDRLRDMHIQRGALPTLTRAWVEIENEFGEWEWAYYECSICTAAGRSDCTCEVEINYCGKCFNRVEECTCNGETTETTDPTETCPGCSHYLDECTCNDNKEEEGEEVSSSTSGGHSGDNNGGGETTTQTENNDNQDNITSDTEDSLSKKIFRNSNMTDANWTLIENMLTKIMNDCVGGTLYNKIDRLLGEGTVAIQFDLTQVAIPNWDGNTLTLTNTESNVLFHEMFHIYQGYQETPESYNKAAANLEVECQIAQYRYLFNLEEFNNDSKWSKWYNNMAFGRMIVDVSKSITKDGQIDYNIMDNTKLSNYLYGLMQIVYDEDSDYTINYSRNTAKNLKNISSLSENC